MLTIENPSLRKIAIFSRIFKCFHMKGEFVTSLFKNGSVPGCDFPLKCHGCIRSANTDFFCKILDLRCESTTAITQLRSFSKTPVLNVWN